MELKRLGTNATGFYKDVSTAKNAPERGGMELAELIVSPGLLEKEFDITELPPKGRELAFFGIPVKVERRWSGVCYKIVWREKSE